MEFSKHTVILQTRIFLRKWTKMSPIYNLKLQRPPTIKGPFWSSTLWFQGDRYGEL